MNEKRKQYCSHVARVPVQMRADVTVVDVGRLVTCCTYSKTSFPLAAAKLMRVCVSFILKWHFSSTFSCSNSSRFIELLCQRLLALKCPFMHFSCGCLGVRSTGESVNLRVNTNIHTHICTRTASLPSVTLSSVRLSIFIEFT